MKYLLMWFMVLGVFAVTLSTAAQTDIISLEYPSLYPEGIEYNPLTDQLLVSSAFEGTVFASNGQGHITPFVEDKRLIATLGLRVDAEQKRLLVLNADGGTARGSSPETAGQIAGLGIYDLATGEVMEYVDLAALIPDSPHFINDLTLDADGNIYITDSFTPAIYRVDSEERAEVFLSDDTFRVDGSVGLNGIVYHPDGYLLVGHYSTGVLYRVPLDSPETFEPVTLEVELVGIDGLVLIDEQHLASVVNGSISQVLMLTSSDQWETATVLNRQPTGEVFPTTAVQVKETLYVLHGYLNHLVNPGTGGAIDTFAIQKIALSDLLGD
jgi:sugar lactone lactonase YvrE